jgi:hypothetical protein
MPWLESLPAGANYAEITWYARDMGGGAYDVNIPEETFDRMMQRAAQHAGYSATSREFKSWHARDVVFENGGTPRDVRTIRKRCLATHELPGAPMVICVYDRESLPFSSFTGCSTAACLDSRHVRRLALRVHRRTKLVFECYVNAAGTMVRRVFVELSLEPEGLASDLTDVRRTIENTVHGVLMGLRLKRAPVDASVS